MKIKSRDIIIESNVDVGLYTFDKESAIGKSRLCQLIAVLKARGVNVDYYDYTKYCDHVILSNTDNIMLFVIDRYDMYNGELTDVISKLYNKCLVVIDSKTGPCDLYSISPYINDISITLVSPNHIVLEDIFV